MISRLLNSLVALAALCAGTAPAQIFVSPTGSDLTGTGSAGSPYKTISFAASQATPGDTLQLTPGVFGDDEQIVLGTKNLSVVGAGAGLSVIVPHPTLTSPLPSGLLPGTLAAFRVAVTVDGPGRIDFRNLTLDCAFRTPGNNRLVGVFFRNGADGTLDGVEIANARANPISAAQRPVGALVRGDDAGDPCDVTFRSCHVHDFGKAGIVGLFNSNVTVQYSIVQGAGDLGFGAPAQIGIQISDGAMGLLRHNTVSDVNYTPTSFAASGILLYNAAMDSRVEGNRVARCEDGIVIFRAPAAAVDMFVRNNKSTQCYGNALRIEGNRRCEVTNNVLHGSDLTFSPVWDTEPVGNTWNQNNYSDWTGAGPYAIPGGSSVDAQPRRGCDEFAGIMGVQLPAPAQDVVVANLDGTVGVDIAVVSAGVSPVLSVLRKRPGTYLGTNIPFGSTNTVAVAIATGEFDGMPGTDLVAITAAAPGLVAVGSIYVFGNNGAGGFSQISAQQMPVTVIAPSGLTVGDVDGDGLDDVGVSHVGAFLVPGGGIVYRNQGGGLSWQSSSLPGTVLASKGIAMAPLDPGNESVDVALIEGDGLTGRVHVYANGGSGTFTEIAGSPFAIAANPTSVEIADMDSDGTNDILATSWGATVPTQAGTLSVLSNQLPSGMPVQALPTGLGPTTIAIGDVANEFDPDTVYPDVVVTSPTAQHVTLFAEFGAVGPAQGALCLPGGNTVTTALADMTGDGYTDLVVVEKLASGVGIRLGRPTARADLFGAGCPGVGGRAPLISTEGDPGVAQRPNPTFGIRVTNAKPMSVGIYIVGIPNGSLAPCTLSVSSIVVLPFPTDSAGSHFFPIPIGSQASLIGANVAGQMAILDDQSPFFNLVSLTEGLIFRIGF